MSHPHVVFSRGKGYLLSKGEYGSIYSDDLTIFATEKKAKEKAVSLTAETSEPHQHECYRFKIAEMARRDHKEGSRRVKQFRKMPFAYVPINKRYVPFEQPDEETVEIAQRNYSLKLNRPLTVLHFALKGTVVMGAIYEQDGEVRGMEEYEFEDFERHFRTEDFASTQKAQRDVATSSQ